MLPASLSNYYQTVRTNVQNRLQASNPSISKLLFGPAIIHHAEADKTIQRRLRELLDRRQVRLNRRHLLPYDLFQNTIQMFEQLKNTQETMPKAINGKTPVFLPKGLPVVIKMTGSPTNQKRFDQMKEAREICEANHTQNLCIPTARVYQDMLIESRVPITEFEIRNSIGLYIENLDKFDQAAAELTLFLCDSTIQDLIGGAECIWNSLSKTSTPRFDNLCIYLEDGIGKIGLIDLEKLSMFPGPCQDACRIAFSFFPFHFDIIMNTAKTFDPSIEKLRPTLEKEKNEILQFFNNVYINHRDFLRRSGISLENPTQPKQLTEERRQKIVDAAKNKLLSIMDDPQFGDDFKILLGEEHEETLNQFAKSCYEMIDKMMDSLRNELTRKVKDFGVITSPIQLCQARALILRHGYRNRQYEKFVEQGHLNMLKCPTSDKWYIMEKVRLEMFKEMQAGGDIALYVEDAESAEIFFI